MLKLSKNIPSQIGLQNFQIWRPKHIVKNKIQLKKIAILRNISAIRRIES